MQLVPGSERIVATPGADPTAGRVRWSPAKSLWIGGMTLATLIAGPLLFSWSAFALFLVATAVTLCAGHSVGMHRRLIHNSFKCPLWLEYLCVYLGVLVGMAGPIGMIRVHDMRDWAQRQSDCHGYFGHRAGFWLDAWRQLHCELVLQRPPDFHLEPRVAHDRVYAWMERTWMLQQLPWALLFYALGGWSWVVWGVCARVTVSVTGHWMVGYFAHREGPQTYLVQGASVQGHDVVIAGLVSMGESWDNNHHAFPGSAKLGLYPGQADLGWVLIKLFERLGLAWDIVTPERLPYRPALRQVRNSGAGCPVGRRLQIRA
ncbi:acyl-CoA desaturase [Phenylobacterium sp.]|uniref:acyl-CoA desaturase n=1 Tax=Phenylobacterium sp. TaxID=1871053 RepID=UPI002810B15E|nr:acyl-CoA desaturase [Phenylobacterium sp.]